MNGLVSLVIPVFNEAGSLEPLLAEIDAALTQLGRPYEVVFVDDGSTDRSFAVMEELAATHPAVRIVKLRRNFGKAAALAHGFAAVRGEAVVTLDGDRQDDPAEIPKMLAALDNGYDLVSGWKQSRQDPLSKTLPSRFFNWTVRESTGIPLHDFNCGLKAYRREVVDNVAIYGELHRYIPVVAAQQGFRVTEEKVAHRRRTSGRSKYGWQRYLRGYLDLLTVLFLGRFQSRPQHLFGGIGTAMIAIGVAVDAYLAVDKIAFGHAIGQRPLLLLGTLLIIVGIQLLSLGLLSELIAYRSAREGLETFQVERTVEFETARADVATRASVLAAEAAATRARAEAELRAAEAAEKWAVDELAVQMTSTESAARGSAQPAVKVKADAAVEDRQRDDA
jgi:glycosyltransferase involved in cell wall biosynthesis